MLTQPCGRADRSEDRNGLKESLLRRGYAADDNRAEAGAPAPAKESNWYSLFGTALVFVWPDTLSDQVRSSARRPMCTAMRVLCMLPGQPPLAC
jgi:hypothetical protein